MQNNTIIAIIGRPNVGKSTLFNRLIGKRKAIETATPGTTLDRLYGDFSWAGKNFILIDTAGIISRGKDEIMTAALAGVDLAIEEAEVIIFVVDYTTGIDPKDIEIARTLRRAKKKVVVAVNKCDNTDRADKSVEFRRLGFDKIIPVASISGRNTGDLLDEVSELAGDIEIAEPVTKDKPDFSLAIIGRPNVGKSTLLNSIADSPKMIVSAIPGTTRDAEEHIVTFKGKKIKLTDTAGIRRKSKIPHDTIESFALLRSLRAVEESDVVVFMIDALEGLVAIDQGILGEAKNLGRSIIIAVNKIDQWENPEEEMAKFLGALTRSLNFMPWVPVVFISAQEKTHINHLLNQAIKAYENRFIEADNEELRKILEEGKSTLPEISYIKELYFERANPPVFKAKIWKADKIHFSHKRFLENRIRDLYGYEGTPIFIDWIRIEKTKK